MFAGAAHAHGFGLADAGGLATVLGGVMPDLIETRIESGRFEGRAMRWRWRIILRR